MRDRATRVGRLSRVVTAVAVLAVAACASDAPSAATTTIGTTALAIEPMTDLTVPADTAAPTTVPDRATMPPTPTTGTPTTTTTTVTASLITRPYVDPAICEAKSASESEFADITLRLFAGPRESPTPIQVIGVSNGDSYNAFALIERFFESNHFPAYPHDQVGIKGMVVSISHYPNGNGEARWSLPDGSTAYLRSRGLDRATLQSIVERLDPRDRSAEIPGFDFVPNAGAEPDLALLAEHLNTGLSGRSARLSCVPPSGDYIYRIDAYDVDPVAGYAFVIDRSAPIDVGVVAGTLIVLNGLDDPIAPTLADITDADPDLWSHLLTQPQY